MNKTIELLKKSYLIRKVETKFLDLFKQGKISGTVHTCVGQEYTGAIVGQHFKEGDLVVSNHRGHGHYIATTNDIPGLVSELLGKHNGASKGIAHAICCPRTGAHNVAQPVLLCQPYE